MSPFLMAADITFAGAPRPSRYLIVPCEHPGCEDLAVIWDRLEEQVVDVIDASRSRQEAEDALNDERKAA